MDYTLASLRDAFEDAEYKRSHRDFKIYGMLLATSLDQQFILEYLRFFNELHSLTANRLLVIGPQLVHRSERKPGQPIPEIELMETELAAASHLVTRENPDGRFSSTADRNEAAGRFLQFMHDQTRESYGIARFLGIRADEMPAFVFFDNLDMPRDYVVWTFHNKTGKEFVLKLRTLLEDVSERCHWGLEETIQGLQKRVELLRREYYWDSDRPYELRSEWEEYRRAQGAHYEAKIADKYYKRLIALRRAYDSACADPNLRLPLENIGQTISNLEAGQIDSGAFDHFAKHVRRWKNRMPPDYRAAIENFGYPYNVIKDGKISLTTEDAAAKTVRLGEEVLRLKGAYERKKETLLHEAEQALVEAEQALVEAKRIASQSTLRELDVIRDTLKDAATSMQKQPPVIDMRSLITESHDVVPKVFISYSHDTTQHKARVLELAQRLRGDGIDAWIDQFEDSPPQGFPRWMQQQIAQADYVLLVCTPIYHIRFDGLEEARKGKGANFEGHLILQTFYDDSALNRKFIPIVFPGTNRDEVPLVLRGTTSYQIPSEYDPLKMRLFAVPNVMPQRLGYALGGGWESF